MKKNFIAVILGIFVALLVAELILRLQNYQYVPLKIKAFEETSNSDLVDDDEDDDSEMGTTDWRPYHEKKDQKVVYSPKLIWQPKKNNSLFNAQGFRGDTVETTKAPNEYRLLAIGDSNTLGPMLSLGWVEYLGQLLEKKHDNVSVINAGVWGYSSWQGLKRFEGMQEYQPDIVLVSFGANDAHRVAISDKEYIFSKRFFKVVHYLRVFQLFMQIDDVWALKRDVTNPFVPRVSLSEYMQNLNTMIDLSEEINSNIILLTRPNLYEYAHHHPLGWINFAAQYNEMTKKVAQSRKVEIIDIYSYFENKKNYFIDDGHFNDEGYKIAAEFIYDHIIGELPQ